MPALVRCIVAVLFVVFTCAAGSLIALAAALPAVRGATYALGIAAVLGIYISCDPVPDPELGLRIRRRAPLVESLLAITGIAIVLYSISAEQLRWSLVQPLLFGLVSALVAAASIERPASAKLEVQPEVDSGDKGGPFA